MHGSAFHNWAQRIPMRFDSPWWLLALLVLVVALAINARSLAGMARWRRRTALALRMVVLTALCCALAGATMLRPQDALCVFFLVDSSHSVGDSQREVALQAINDATRSMRRGKDRMGVIVFGQEASMETAPSLSPTIDKLETVTERYQTDIAQAIRLALASFPEGSAKRIVLLSDGNETLGRAVDEARVARANDVPIDTVRLATPYAAEVALDSMFLPSRAKVGEPFELRIVLSSLKAGRGTLYVERNKQLLGESPVSYGAGKSVFRLRQSIEEAGFWNYEVKLVADADTLLENNRALGFVAVAGEPRVLLVSKDLDADAHLGMALEEGHIAVDAVGPTGIPLDIGEIVQYDAVVFSNVPAMAMRTEQMEVIRAACRDLGVGFGMVGGEDSFGLGGYYKTPVEETLPVNMDITHKEHFPGTSLVICVDTSGSMGAMEGNRTKQEIANEAAGLAAELLSPRDELCVFGSEDKAGEVFPLAKVTDIPEAKRMIARMRPGGGGIYVRPSLARSYEILNSKATGQIKHVIVLADGSDCDSQEGCVDAARQALAEHNITTTFVSLGNGPHTPFQKQVADAGGGRLYVAERMEDVPRIYTKETLLVARSLMCEEPFLPTVDTGAPPLKGIDWATAPPLLGYVGTSEKPAAQVFMRTHKDDPLLASWQFGLGRSIAFTSDAQNRWAAEWIGWPAYDKFWQQSVRWMLRSLDEGMFDATVQIERGQGTLSVEALGGEDEFLNNLDIRARLVTPDNEGHDVKLEQIAPGRYQQRFDAQATGAYMANLTYTLPDGQKESQTAGAVVPYPEEYRQLAADDFLLTRVAETSGGATREASELAGLYESARATVRTPTPVWPQLLLLGAILLPFDVAVRRLVLDQRQWEMAREKAQELRARLARGRREAKPADGTVEALLTTKQETWEERPTGAPVVQAGPQVAAPPPAENEAARRLREQLAAAAARKQPEQAPPSAEAEADQGDTFSRLMAAKKRVNR